MTNKRFSQLAALVAVLCAFPCLGQENVIEEARLDITAKNSSIDGGWLIPERGWFGRMTWLPDSKQDSTYVASFPVVDYAPSSAVFRFHCRRATTVILELRGPHRPQPDGSLRRVDIEWSSLSIEGGQLAAPPKLPAISWHDEPLTLQIDVDRESDVRIAATARLAPERYEPPPAATFDDAADQLARQFLKGINLANFLEVPPGEDWGDNRCTEDDYAAIAKEGFDHVRIPVGWHHHCGPAPEFLISDLYFQQVEQQLDWAEKHHLAAIINVHHFDAFTTDPKSHREKLRKIWQQIALRMVNRPLTLAYEIINEPNDAATTEVMSQVYAEIITTIRTHDPRRAILVGPGKFNSTDELPLLKLPQDDRLIATFHLYDPHFFTHQGAPWGGESAILRDVVFPGPPFRPLQAPELATEGMRRWVEAYNQTPRQDNPSGMASILSRIEWAVAWGKRYNRPIYLGEFGAYTVANERSRINYLSAVRSAAESHGVGWAIWDWKAAFAYWDRRQQKPLPGLHKAVFGN